MHTVPSSTAICLFLSTLQTLIANDHHQDFLQKFKNESEMLLFVTSLRYYKIHMLQYDEITPK